jgi:hypothetical protein
VVMVQPGWSGSPARTVVTGLPSSSTSSTSGTGGAGRATVRRIEAVLAP